MQNDNVHFIRKRTLHDILKAASLREAIFFQNIKNKIVLFLYRWTEIYFIFAHISWQASLTFSIYKPISNIKISNIKKGSLKCN